MKAAVQVRAGPPDVLVYRDVPAPAVAPDELLIAVEAIAIEGGDLINRRVATPPGPVWVPGYAASGTVAAVGTAVRDRHLGDRVTAFSLKGSYAELWAVPAMRTWKVPAGVDMAQAASLPIAFGTAHHCLFARAGLQHGESVLIQAAAGGVGLAAVQLAAQAGAIVLAVASGSQRSGRIQALGAYHVVDRTERDVVADVRRVTGERGVDVVIDPVGSTLPASLAALACGGRLVFVGNAGGCGLGVDLWSPMQSNQSLLGVFMGPLLETHAVRASVGKMLEALAEGKIQVLIDRSFPLSDVVAAHGYAETAKPLGRVVMKP
jgi:NADPH:quinone reductase-like Zn-dependent oxidoreductase